MLFRYPMLLKGITGQLTESRVRPKQSLPCIDDENAIRPAAPNAVLCISSRSITPFRSVTSRVMAQTMKPFSVLMGNTTLSMDTCEPSVTRNNSSSVTLPIPGACPISRICLSCGTHCLFGVSFLVRASQPQTVHPRGNAQELLAL